MSSSVILPLSRRVLVWDDSHSTNSVELIYSSWVKISPGALILASPLSKTLRMFLASLMVDERSVVVFSIAGDFLCDPR